MSNDEWGTPPLLFRKLDTHFEFTLDAFASKENAKCGRWFTKEQDGFKRDWDSLSVFANPPYSKESGGASACLQKAHGEIIKRNCFSAVVLVMSDTSTAYFHYALLHAQEICFLTPRVNFAGAKGSPKFGSMVVHFQSSPRDGTLVFSLWQWRKEEWRERRSWQASGVERKLISEEESKLSRIDPQISETKGSYISLGVLNATLNGAGKTG